MKSLVPFLFMIAWCGPTFSQEDAVRMRLEKAKETYAAEFEKTKQALADWYKKEDEAARKVGKKDRVDQLKADKDAFDSTGLVPQNIPPAMRTKLASLRAAMNLAYGTAIKEYTKAKMDAQADEVKTAWLEFKSDPKGDPDVIFFLNRSAQKYLVAGEAKGKDETHVVLGKETSEDKSHLWRLAPAGGGWFTIQTLDGTAYLGTEASRVDKEARVVIGALREAKVAFTQHWQFVATDSGYWKVVNRASAKTLHTLGRSKNTGAEVVIWDDEKVAPHAEWRIR